MQKQQAKSISRYLWLVLFLNTACVFSQLSLGDSVIRFYNTHTYFSHFLSTYYSNTGSIETIKGRICGYTDKEIYYRLNLDTMLYGDKKDFMGMDCVRNKTTIGCNYATDKTYTDLSQNAEKYDQTVGFYLPVHIVDPDTLKVMLADKNRFIINIIEEKDFYYATSIDTHIVNLGFEKQIKSMSRYKISKKDYRVLSFDFHYDFSVDNVVLRDSSETFYFYDKKTDNEIYAYVNSFRPFKKEIIVTKDVHPQDTVSYFPDFILIDSLKQPFHSKSIGARYTLIEFWYRGCLPCMVNIKKLNTLRNSFDKTLLEIVAVNDHDALNPELKRFIGKFKPNYTLLFNGQSLKKTLGLSIYPTTYIYDTRTNKVIYYKKGTDEHYTEDIISALNNPN